MCGAWIGGGFRIWEFIISISLIYNFLNEP